ncbi:sulfite exporter TauE/SafE family protein [candidate division WWE3 bacterium]|uniref:Sulfite exporter TauE/SafE family protein n=1 Tax=candidate division WWE3 bacterium TaxID=2053526 RepID=A0A955J1W6_UNCKA|nr:sulfite exporter TauE/SafE family protein [candidate division WWE3 bacterium]
MFNLDGSQINLFIALIAGIITFFASCLLPLVPTYLAYLAGLSTTNDIKNKQVFINGVLFTLGFIIIFVLLGATANSLGRLLIEYKTLMQKLGGGMLIIMGLLMLEIYTPTFLYKERRLDAKSFRTKWQKVNSLLVGFTFGLAWTPCIGPVLAVILFWSSQTTSFLYGVSLLLAYGIGLGIPFIIIALFFEKLAPRLREFNRFGNVLQKVAGGIIIIMGILLILDKVQIISLKALELLQLSSIAV